VQPILSIQDLTLTFGPKKGRRLLPAVNGVSLDLRRGEILGLVGESGSGKSVTLRSIPGLTRQHGMLRGKVMWEGKDLVTLSDAALRPILGKDIAMIFQEPMTALNPLLTVGVQITESLKAHTTLEARERMRRAVEVLDMVGIPGAAGRLNDYPHQFSGGMRQRVMIAIALASTPKLLLADEPTTALDVTIQAQILDLIAQLARDFDMGVILVTHDLGVVAQSCDRVAVMYAGRIVEQGTVRTVLGNPRHPYTNGLMRSVPQNVPPRTQLFSIPGTPPSLWNMPPGCAFAPRCAQAIARCTAEVPPLSALEAGHLAACHCPLGAAQ
jgi:oligopeptide transport system ATP-binding protein